MEGTLVAWLVREGDSVKRDQPIAEITTDKVDTELPSPVEGRIVTLHRRPGDPLGAGPFITFEV